MTGSKLTLSEDKDKWGVRLKAEPDFKVLGRRLKGDIKAVQEILKNMPDSELAKFLEEGKMTIKGHELTMEDLKVGYTVAGDTTLHEKYAADSDGEVIVLIDVSPDQSLQDEGLAREIVNRIQKLRKKLKLMPYDDVRIHCSVTPPDSELGRVLKEQLELVENSVKQPVEISQSGSKLKLIIEDRRSGGNANSVANSVTGSGEGYTGHGPVVTVMGPNGQSVNVALHSESEGKLTYSRLRLEAAALFNLWDEPGFRLSTTGGKGGDFIPPMDDVQLLKGKTVYVSLS